MKKTAGLIENTLILFLGVCGAKLINFVMLPFYTNWLTVEEYGEIDVLMTVVSVCVPILTLQLDQAIFRFLIDDQTISLKQETVTSASICIAGIFVLVIGGYFLSGTTSIIASFVMMEILLQSIHISIQQVIRGLGKSHIYAIDGVLVTFVNTGLSIIFIRVLNGGVRGYIGASCGAYLLGTIFLCIHAKIHTIIELSKFSFVKLREMIRYSLPMILNNISWWILNASDKFILNIALGVSANGIYAAAGKIPGIITTIYSVFHIAWQEETSRIKNKKTTYFSDVFRKVFAVCSFAVSCILLLGPMLFSVLIDEKYSIAYNHIPVLLLALFFFCIAQFYGGIFVGEKNTKVLGATSAVAAIINMIINLLLVARIEVYAASLSTLMAYAFLCIIRVYKANVAFRIKYNCSEILLCCGCVLIAFVAAYLPWPMVRITLLLCIIVLYAVIYKDVCEEIVCLIRKKLQINR